MREMYMLVQNYAFQMFYFLPSIFQLYQWIERKCNFLFIFPFLLPSTSMERKFMFSILLVFYSFNFPSFQFSFHSTKQNFESLSEVCYSRLSLLALLS